MKVAEIFESFAGEVNGHHQGRVVTFLRLQGCNLQCSYCDTAETQEPNPEDCEDTTMAEILEIIRHLGHKHICLTGGEPLMNKSNAIELLHLLWSEGYKISVETNGTIDITPFFRYVESFVVDYKMGTMPLFVRRIMTNYTKLRKTDVIKFVVQNEREALEAFSIKALFEGIPEVHTDVIMAFSPVMPGMSPKQLANLLLEHKIRNSLISLQIHKLIGFK